MYICRIFRIFVNTYFSIIKQLNCKRKRKKDIQNKKNSKKKIIKNQKKKKEAKCKNNIGAISKKVVVPQQMTSYPMTETTQDN